MSKASHLSFLPEKLPGNKSQSLIPTDSQQKKNKHLQTISPYNTSQQLWATDVKKTHCQWSVAKVQDYCFSYPIPQGHFSAEASLLFFSLCLILSHWAFRLILFPACTHLSTTPLFFVDPEWWGRFRQTHNLIWQLHTAICEWTKGLRAQAFVVFGKDLMNLPRDHVCGLWLC